MMENYNMKITIDDKQKTVYICEIVNAIEFAEWVLYHPEYHTYNIIGSYYTDVNIYTSTGKYKLYVSSPGTGECWHNM